MLLTLGAMLPLAQAAGVRENTRLFKADGTQISSTQASELTLTLTDAALRPIQTWVRTAGQIDASGLKVVATLRSADAQLVKPGQRLRAFSVNSRMQMLQGRVSRVTPRPDGALVEAMLTAPARDPSRYVLEIVVERGPYLSVPNVALIEEGTGPVVYVQQQPGQYTRRAIRTGLQGELYTQVLEGLEPGDQVVSIGSFFVDADNKLKSPN